MHGILSVMAIFDAIILGFVQGLTEFLPISSSGHLVIVGEFLKLDAINTLAFDGMLHFATALAVVLYFWSDLWVLIQSVLRKLSRLPVNQKDLTLFYALMIGTIPAVALGLIIEPFFNRDAQSAGLVAILILLASIFLMYAEWRYYLRSNNEPISVKRAWQIGLFQVLALMPGFSRTGVTIAGGMLAGMSRLEATRFSFLLAIPVTLGVGSKKLLELLKADGIVDWFPVLIGCATALVTSMIVIHFFLAFMQRRTLWAFIWYGVILACLVGYISFIA